ncbi:HNH endonuclease [Enterobacter kobei]|uniref:HNH endonuclease n=1 Tax=Enterobacter kobei TaxID=208224 RepID=UPI001A16FDD0|nr:HNH endonuclease signature motif containing protein [Enterobacter kobei]EKY1591856.1 HNH endonuclease [Enterobacter kobei]MBX8891529.1 HNH endonuclease [Enterobacter kobei]MCK6870093.1 HNH endonuclease [Enterobacter kobei]HDS5355515.1 HNH endonuclease [Enterobacter kobei]
MKIVRALLTQDEKIWLSLALACKKARDVSLPALKTEIYGKYNDYVDIINGLENNLPESIFSSEVNRDLKKHFIDLYNNPTSKLKELLISKRREHALTSCPYCGNPTIPDTLDHFIPKDKLAEYSIFPNNLVPQCRSCAPIKGDKYFSYENDLVMFAHPFYSNLLDNVIIDIISSLDETGINFQVQFSTRTENILEQKAIILHVKSLKIKERILIYCDKEIKKWIRKLKKRNFNIEHVLLARYSEHDLHEARSNWEFILYRSLLENVAVMQYLKSISPEVQQNNSDERELIILDI